MQDPTVILTDECTLLYPELFEPNVFGKDTEPKYRATFLFNPGTDLKPYREACRQAAWKKFGTGIQLNTLKYPIRDGNEKAVDENGKPDPNSFYYNRMYIAAKSKFKIPVVNIYNEEITEEEIYGGCVVRAYLSFYGYAYMGNGVAVGLRAVCKISDGEPLGGGKINTAEVFKDFVKPKDTFMDLPPSGTKDQYDNELGQQNHDPLRDSDPWGNNNSQREPGDELPEDMPF